MYPILLALHNILRWVVVLAGAAALFRAYRGWLGNQTWNSTDRALSVTFTSALDTQFLIGLLLYFLFSPLTRAALQNFRAAMGSPELRFFGLEHFAYMLVALVVAHIGSARARRSEADSGRFRQAAIWFSLALLIILVAIPWGRPLLPGLG